MATNKPIISIVIDDETLRRIENYQFKNRINSRSRAINDLILKGLEVIENEND